MFFFSSSTLENCSISPLTLSLERLKCRRREIASACLRGTPKNTSRYGTMALALAGFSHIIIELKQLLIYFVCHAEHESEAVCDGIVGGNACVILAFPPHNSSFLLSMFRGKDETSSRTTNKAVLSPIQ